MQASLAPINQSLDALRKKPDNYEPRLTEMEEALKDHSDRLTSSEKRVEKLQQGNKELNEGDVVSAFMSQFLADLVQDDSFWMPPGWIERSARRGPSRQMEGDHGRSSTPFFAVNRERATRHHSPTRAQDLSLSSSEYCT